MRAILLALSVLCLGGAAVFLWGMENSFSSYSSDQMAVIERSLKEVSTQPGKAGDEARASMGLMRDEQRRRPIAWALLGGGILFGAAAAVMQLRRRSSGDSRLLATFEGAAHAHGNTGAEPQR